MTDASIDWSECPEVERVAGRRGGNPVLRGSRVTPAEVVTNYEHGSPVEEISENFGLPVEQLRAVLEYAAHQVHSPRP